MRDLLANDERVFDLSNDEIGAYWRLLVAYRRLSKTLPDDDALLARYAKVSLIIWKRHLRPILEPFFVVKLGTWRHAIADQAIDVDKDISDKRRVSGRAGALARIANQKQTRRKTVTKPEPEDDGFPALWAAYPRHDDQGHAKKAYASALKTATKEEILAGAVRYAERRKGEDPKFTAMLATWLSGERWKDVAPLRLAFADPQPGDEDYDPRYDKKRGGIFPLSSPAGG